MSYLRYLCLDSNTYSVVFVVFVSWFDAPYVASFLGSFRFLIAPSVFSNVYICNVHVSVL